MADMEWVEKLAEVVALAKGIAAPLSSEEAEQLIAAVRLANELSPYTEHHPICAVGENAMRLRALVCEWQDKMPKCDCGLDKLLARLRSGKVEEKR